MVPRTRALLLTAVALALVAPAAAAPPPEPVCDACGDTFERHAEYHGVDVTVDRSTATVTVAENGTATWVVRNDLAPSPAVDRLRSNATLLTEATRTALRNADFVAANVSADGVLTMTFRRPDFAERGVGGTLRSGEFTRSFGYRNLDGLGADRLVVVAPEGTRVAASVPGSTVSDDGVRMTLTDFDRGGFVTFVPESATLGFLLSWLSIAAVVGPVVVQNALLGVALPAAVVAVLVVGAGRLLPELDGVLGAIRARPGRSLLLAGVAGVGLSFAGRVLSVFGTGLPVLFGVSVTAVGLGAVLVGTGPVRWTYGRALAVAVLGAAVAAVAVAAGSVLFYGRVPWFGLGPRLALLTAVFAFLPAGFALRRGQRRLGVATAAAGVVLALGATTPLVDTYQVFGLGFRVVLALGDALWLAALGVPLLVVGAALAGSGT
ncbi:MULTISPECIES: hypothetical protein [Salinibaculum]|uniref:hypothetical protein n=1 Tax=Salinibaculum TaxID=2732368 RepID=UPI0030CB556E